MNHVGATVRLYIFNYCGCMPNFTVAVIASDLATAEQLRDAKATEYYASARVHESMWWQGTEVREITEGLALVLVEGGVVEEGVVAD